MTGKPLKLSAEDAQDLTVISACLQDAITRRSAISYQKPQRRFAAVFNRYRWEGAPPDSAGAAPQRTGVVPHGTEGARIRTGVHFEGVLNVQSKGLPEDTDTPIELLAMRSEPGVEGAATIVLEFAGGAAIRLEVECIDCYLSDLGRSWQALRRPTHGDSDN